jgi:hypothetical protein
MFQDKWNILDTIVVVSSIISFGPADLSFFKSMR